MQVALFHSFLTYIDFFTFFSIMIYLKILNIVPYTMELIVYPFYTKQYASADPKLPLHPSSTPPTPLGNHKSVLYVCESGSVL